METYVPPLTTAVKAFASLSDKQLLALEALLQGKSRAEVACLAGTSERSLRRWQHDPTFRMALQQARCDLWMETASLLQQGNRKAVQALLEAVDDGDHQYARVLAARTILDYTVKALTVDAIGSRCDQTEHDIERLLRGALNVEAPDTGTPPPGGAPDHDPDSDLDLEDTEDEAPVPAPVRAEAAHASRTLDPGHPGPAGHPGREEHRPRRPADQPRTHHLRSPLARIEAFCRRLAPRRPICNLQSSICTLQLPGVA